MQEATRYYPLVGVLVGLLGAAVFQLLSLLLPVLPSLILMISATIWLTGAFHEDGFADMCDGIGGGHTREQMLDIMRDSRLGTYGVVGIMMLLLIKLSLLWNLVTTDTTIFLTAFVVAHCLSRTSAVLVIATSRYVRDAGVAKPVASGLSHLGIITVVLTSLVCLTVAALMIGASSIVVATAGLLIAHLLVRRLFERKLDGYTGDCLGATQQVSEAGFYLGLVMCI